MTTTLVRRVVPVMVVAALFGVLVRMQVRPPLSGDGYFHIRLGHELLSGWSVSDPGHLGPFDTADWLPTQWLSQIVMAAVDQAAGLAGVIWVFGLLVLLLALTIYLSCRRQSAPLTAALATVLACSAASPGLSARPQVTSYLLVVVVTTAWLATLRDGQPRWWLIGVAWLWAPLHGMWPISILVGVAAVVGLALERERSFREIGRLAAIPLASAAVVLLTPVGSGIYESVVVVSSRTDYFAEWGPTDFTKPYALALLGSLGIVLLVGVRLRQLSWGELAVTGLALALAVSSARMTPVAAVMLAPLVASALQTFVPDSPGVTRREAVALGAVLVTAALALIPVASARAKDPVAPSWVDSRLDSLPSGTRVLNDWDTGAYFLWRHPQLALVMHGYGDVFTDEELERNIDILRLRPGWDNEVQGLDVDVALVNPDTPLGYALMHTAGWDVVQSDTDFALLTAP